MLTVNIIGMKKIILSLAAMMVVGIGFAQDFIRVNYNGASPSISDFVTAFVNSNDCDDDEEEECCVDESFNALRYAWETHLKGLPQNENVMLGIDEKNGYVVYEYRDEEDMLRIEMCYWNEADKKHKLFAYNVACYRSGRHEPGQFDGLLFWRYDNATKKMTSTDDVGFQVQYGTEDGAYVSYALPRTGKDIIVTYWYKDSKKQRTLKWGGRRFSF